MDAPEPTDHHGATPPPRLAPVEGGPPRAGAPSWGALDRLAAMPLPVITAVILALWIFDVPRAYQSPPILLALNLVFITLVSALVAYLALRGFHVRGEPGLLLLSLGAELMAAGALLSSVAGWGDPNRAVTIHNTCALLAGCCHLAGAIAARRPRRTVRAVDGAAAGALGLGLLVPALLSGAALSGWTPTFFVQGAGGTPVRDLVVGGAALAFAAAAAILLAGPPPTRFKRYYALALALVAVGLGGVLVQASFGGLLGWAARATQYLGGTYMLVAAIVAVHEAKGWALSLEAGLADAESLLRNREARFSAFFESLREAVVVYEAVRGPRGDVIDWVVREANELYAKALGVPRARIVGARIGDTFGAERLAHWSPEWRGVLETGEPHSYERLVAGRTYAVTTFRLDGATIAASALDITER